MHEQKTVQVNVWLSVLLLPPISPRPWVWEGRAGSRAQSGAQEGALECESVSLVCSAVGGGQSWLPRESGSRGPRSGGEQ